MEWLKRNVKLNCPDFVSDPSVLEEKFVKNVCDSSQIFFLL